MKVFSGMYSFFESLGKYAGSFSNMFLIFLGAFLAMSVIVIIITSFAYECKLTKTIDKINKFLERNPRINDDNLVAFNNMMKANSVPKTLRRQWQQFMLYREHPASYYMSFKHCVENPLRNSTYNQQMTVYKIISYVLVVLGFIVSVFMANNSYNSNLVLREVMVIPLTILVLYWVISMVLNLIHSAVSGDLFQNYQYFEINIDKAMLTLPEFVDYEVLFSQDEIRRGIPVLYAYLQKRAIQEQQELEKARLKSIDHEKFDFDKAGLDGSLVLDRAMHETENYTTQRKQYMQEIERVNNEISVLENNYKEQMKEFQRQVQTSKETVESLKEQLEQATSTIEINYIKKQMRDELNRQQLAEKDFDILTDKHNQEIKTLNQEIKHYDEETKKAKEAMEVAMLSEFNTYSIKVYDNLEKIVDEKMQDRVDDYKDQIKGLEIELEEKNEELENVYTRYQEALSQIPVEEESAIAENYEELPTKKGKKKKKASQDENSDSGMVQPEQIQEDVQPEYNDYNYQSNDYDQYNPEQDYAYDGNNYNQNYIPTEQYNEQTDYIPNDGYVEDNYMGQPQDEYIPVDDNLYNDSFDNYVPLDDNIQSAEEYVPQSEEYIPQNEEYIPQEQYVPLNDYSQEGFVGGEYVPLDNEYVPQTEESVPAENEYTMQEEQETLEKYPMEEQVQNQEEGGLAEFDDSDFDIEFNKPAKSLNNFEDMDFDFVFGEEQKEEKPREEKQEEYEVVDDGEDFDLNKILGLYDTEPNKDEKEETSNDINEESKEEIVEKPKRKAGRPRKIVDESEIKPKRRVGRPRKVVDETESETPKRKAGRPRKIVDESEVNPKRGVGRPRKTEKIEEKPLKRKAGRPRKTEVEIKTSTGKRGRPRKTETIVEKKVERRGRPRKAESIKATTPKAIVKRGRPRKTVNNNQVINSQGVLGKPKRKAGRPRKNA